MWNPNFDGDSTHFVYFYCEHEHHHRPVSRTLHGAFFCKDLELWEEDHVRLHGMALRERSKLERSQRACHVGDTHAQLVQLLSQNETCSK